MLLLYLFLLLLISCDISEEESIEEIEKSKRIEITETFHGGIIGSGQVKYVLKRSGIFPETHD